MCDPDQPVACSNISTVSHRCHDSRCFLILCPSEKEDHAHRPGVLRLNARFVPERPGSHLVAAPRIYQFTDRPWVIPVQPTRLLANWRNISCRSCSEPGKDRKYLFARSIVLASFQFRQQSKPRPLPCLSCPAQTGDFFLTKPLMFNVQLLIVQGEIHLR